MIFKMLPKDIVLLIIRFHFAGFIKTLIVQIPGEGI